MGLRVERVVEKGRAKLSVVRDAPPPPPPAFTRDVSFLRKAGEEGEEKRLVYGIVLEPETPDSQGDIYSAEEVEAAAHGFMANYQNVGSMHRVLVNDGAEVVESYIAPGDFSVGDQKVQAGTWILVVHVMSDTLWQQVTTGELTGFSIGGYAERTPIAGE